MTHRILVVEDDPDTATVLTLLFETEGYTVNLATSLAEAHATLRAVPPPDVVLLDVVLPDGDGLSLCAALHGRWPDLPILCVTAHVDPAIGPRATAAGCRDIVTKPFDPDALVARVRTLLGPP